MLKRTILLSVLASVFLTELCFSQGHNTAERNHRFKISFGNTGGVTSTKKISFGGDVAITSIIGKGTEKNDRVGEEVLLHFGDGDVDELILDISWRKPSAERLPIYQKAKMWRYLLANGAPGQINRLQQDPWNQPDAPLLTIYLAEDKTEGFSFSLELLLEHRAMWLPEHDIFLTAAENPIDFQQHVASLKEERTLQRIKREPDASLEQFKSYWKDIGNPLLYDVPWQTKYLGTTGHLIVTAAAHGSVYKFAIDRWGRVRPDFASPHKFRMDPVWPDSHWKSQRIENGLPVVLTTLEKDNQSCEIEQFASPLGEIKEGVAGQIPGVLFSRIKISGGGYLDFRIAFSNETADQQVELKTVDDDWIVSDVRTGNILLMLQTEAKLSVRIHELRPEEKGQTIVLGINGETGSGESREILVKLPSPAITSSRISQLKALDFQNAKSAVVDYWEKWLGRGAQFHVPEKSVNDLFRANLWHALILPRHTLETNGELHMDLPYANTAYGQKNSDWPVNQAVYVDYMIYGLRGYYKVAEDEIAAMFRTQQQPDGRISGFANWGVYSPAHLYTIAQNYLLSGDRESFARLLPDAMKTLDWCLAQVKEANALDSSTGLIVAPLNDLSHGEREWAFTQAYFVGGLELFGKALSTYRHPRADEVLKASAQMRMDVGKAFARSSVKSPVVQLKDGTWINYVPSDAMTPRRLMDQWYPTDVDTGPLHLARLGAIDATGWLTNAMLHDHEDNLFLDNKGAANEPVYVQQATAYLMRDEPKAVIRSFYSLMACGFSHEQYSPLEHRWAHGQYYGPPSTDGAWFEIYRKMLVNELGDDSLIIGQAIPRAWLKSGQKIGVKNAPTYFGEVSFVIESKSSEEIAATIELSPRKQPAGLVVRFRHPNSKTIRSVVVNGKAWKHYDNKKEQIIIPNPREKRYIVSAMY